jgi:hypothetical protein
MQQLDRFDTHSGFECGRKHRRRIPEHYAD